MVSYFKTKDQTGQHVLDYITSKFNWINILLFLPATFARISTTFQNFTMTVNICLITTERLQHIVDDHFSYNMHFTKSKFFPQVLIEEVAETIQKAFSIFIKYQFENPMYHPKTYSGGELHDVGSSNLRQTDAGVMQKIFQILMGISQNDVQL